MARIVVRVESNEIAVEDTEQNLVTDGQDSVDLGAREGRVQEEANLDILFRVAKLFSQHRRHEHQVVVVHPDHVIVLYVLCNSLCKQTVGFGVCVPGRLVEGDLTRVVVEERPHNLVWDWLVLDRLQLGRFISLEKPL